MDVTVGTFNLNNLSSRFNFRAHVDEVPEEDRDVTVTYEFTYGRPRVESARGTTAHPRIFIPTAHGRPGSPCRR
jgi:hypothetical protein